LERAREGDGIGKLSCAWRAGEAACLRCVGRDGGGRRIRTRLGLVDDEFRDERQLTTICTG
jgi:hypothetical protein